MLDFSTYYVHEFILVLPLLLPNTTYFTKATKIMYRYYYYFHGVVIPSFLCCKVIHYEDHSSNELFHISDFIIMSHLISSLNTSHIMSHIMSHLISSHISSTLAPASINCFIIFSASSFFNPFISTTGTLSTISFAYNKRNVDLKLDRLKCWIH